MSLPDQLVTWRQLWGEATQRVRDRVVARWLCEHASGCEKVEFDGILDNFATQRQVAHLDAMLARLDQGEPVQYVMGRWAFRHLDVMVDERVLIPRPETELIVDIVRDRCNEVLRRQQKCVVVDLGTGSGVIGLSVLAEMPLQRCDVWMTDASIDAIDVARANASGLGRPATHAHFAMGNWYEALPRHLLAGCDVIVSNPPYIAVDDNEIEESVRQWEPHMALFANDDGYSDIEVIVSKAPQWLVQNGCVVVEMGHLQADRVSELFHRSGFHDVVVHQDLAGKNRFVSGRLS